MSHTIATTEPEKVYAGDRWQWTKALANYPANEGWTLTYYLHGQDCAEGIQRHITITCTADDSDHAADVAAGTTVNYVPGTYWWSARVSDGTSSYSVGTGTVAVLANPATIITSHDGRSPKKKLLDAIDETLLTAASRPDSSYSVMGTSITAKSLTELKAIRNEVAAEVAAEEAQAALDAGKGSGMNVFMRFSTPS